MTVAENIARSLFDDFTDIKNKHKVRDNDFKYGLEFCVRLSTGESRTVVWKEIYGGDGDPARDSTRFMKLKWVEDVLHRLYTSNHFQHVDDRAQILKRMRDIALDLGATHKSNIDAAKVFLDSTAMPDRLNVDVNIDVSDEAKLAFNNMVTAIGMVANGTINGVISPEGEVVDVKLVH